MKRTTKVETACNCVLCGQNRLVSVAGTKTYTRQDGTESTYETKDVVESEDNVLRVVHVSEFAENYLDWYVDFRICETCIDDIAKLQETLKYMKKNNVLEMTTEV